MSTSAQSTLMHAPAAREDLVRPRRHDRPLVRAFQRLWCALCGLVKAERAARPEPYGANVGLFILGYGKLPGTHKRDSRPF